jgi:hypothetical protein
MFKHLCLAVVAATTCTVGNTKETVQVPIDCYQSDNVIKAYVDAKTWEPMVILDNDQSQVVLMRDKSDNDVHVWLYFGDTMCMVERGTLKGFKAPQERFM